MVYMCDINEYPAPWISSPETFLYSLWLAYEYWQWGPPSALTLNSMNYTHLWLSAATEALRFLFYYRSLGRFLSVGREHTSSTAEFTTGAEDVADISNWNIIEFSKYILRSLNDENVLCNIYVFIENKPYEKRFSNIQRHSIFHTIH